MKPLSFHEYQLEGASKFKEHKSLTAEQARLLDWTLGVAGESGELLEAVKHHVYSEEELDKMKMAKEIGDVLWYLSALAKTLDINLADCAELNLRKLRHRHGQSYSHQSSKDRHHREQKFHETKEYQEIERRILGE